MPYTFTIEKISHHRYNIWTCSNDNRSYKRDHDKYNIVWIGTASWGDILADFIGVLLGYILLLLGYRCNILYNDYGT